MITKRYIQLKVPVDRESSISTPRTVPLRDLLEVLSLLYHCHPGAAFPIEFWQAFEVRL